MNGWLNLATACALVLVGTYDLFAGTFAHTQQAASITSNSAVLNGMVTPNGAETAAWFEWGEGRSYSSLTPAMSAGAGSSVVRLSAAITGLEKGKVYICRIVASNATAVVHGAPRLFTTGRKVVAWGDNASFQCDALPFSDVVGVDAGEAHSLVLRANGRMAAWGASDRQQIAVPSNLSNVVQVAAGADHNVALRSNGTVVAWGWNYLGQTNVPSGLADVIEIACGASHNLALLRNGTVAAWGWNGYGQTEVPPGLSNVVSIAADVSVSFALKDDGSAVAWGHSSHTNLPPALSNVVEITCGVVHRVARTADGAVLAWGFGDTNVPPAVTNILQLAAGYYHNAALNYDGTLRMWGSNNVGQIMAPPTVLDVVSVACGDHHTLALASNIAPRAFAQAVDVPANADAVITLSGTDTNRDPIQFRVMTTPARGMLYQYANGDRGALISAGADVSDGLHRLIFAPEPDAFGSSYAAFDVVANDGEDDSEPAQIVVNVVGQPYAVTQPAFRSTATSALLHGMAVPNGFDTAVWFEWGTAGVAGAFPNSTATTNIGRGHAVVRVGTATVGLAPGSVYQFRMVASNSAGLTLGAPHFFTTGSKVGGWDAGYSGFYGQLKPPSNYTDIVAVAAGQYHSVGLRVDGRVVAWGSYNSIYLPPGLTNILCISTLGDYNLALRGDGRLIAWNWGRAAFQYTNLIAVAAGPMSTALKSDGTVLFWSDGPAYSPPTWTNIVAIAAGNSHRLGLRADGTVIAWGSVDLVKVPSDLRDVVAIAAANDHSLALRRDGGVVKWGNNSFVPNGLSNVVSIAASEWASFALKADGAVVAWSTWTGQTYNPPDAGFLAAVAGGQYHGVALGNFQPVGTDETFAGFPNVDTVLTLTAIDVNSDPLTRRITSLPTAGALHQYAAGSPGPIIASANTTVTDTLGRVIFVPAPDSFGIPYTSFAFVAADGESESFPATATIDIALPAVPVIAGSRSRWLDGNAFELNFTGTSNAAYRVWASTNLVDWEVVGAASETSNSWFHFLDLNAGSVSQRFYRCTAP